MHLVFSSVGPSVSVRLFDLGSGLPVEPVKGSETGVQSSPVQKMSDQTFLCPVNMSYKQGVTRQKRVESDIKYVWFEGVKPDIFYVWFLG